MKFEEEMNSNIHLMEMQELYQEQFEEGVQLMEMEFGDTVLMEEDEFDGIEFPF